MQKLKLWQLFKSLLPDLSGDFELYKQSVLKFLQGSSVIMITALD